MPPLEPSPKLSLDASPSVASDASLLEAELRSSFIQMVNNALGAAERTSSFKSHEAQLDFALGNEVQQDAEPPPDQIAGRFTVREAIGRGGFGTVYLAHDESLDRDVAIKVPHEKLRSDPQLSSQCLKEARLAAKLRHPSIVTIFDISEEEGKIAYIVQEYVHGATLYELISKQRFSVKQTILLIMKVAEAIAFAHARGVYHRDLKPANLIVDETGGIRVLDFGLAVDEEMQRGARGQVAGTIAYMSPEQIEGRTHHLDGRTDIWSLGVIFYELLAGKRPFRGNADEVSDQIIRREALPPRQFMPSIPKKVEACCLKCLSKSVATRYATAIDLLEDLTEIVETEPLPEDLPSGPLPPLPPHDTKRLGKDTTKNVSKTTGRTIPLSIIGTIAVVMAIMIPLALNQLDESTKRDQSVPNEIPPAEKERSETESKKVSKQAPFSTDKSGVQFDLMESKPKDFLVTRVDPGGATFDENKLKIHGMRNRAVIFDRLISNSHYVLKADFAQVPDWNGSSGLLFGVRRSPISPNISLAFVVEVAKSKFDGAWQMHFSHIVVDTSTGKTLDAIYLAERIKLRVPPSAESRLEIYLKDGELGSVVFAGEYYGDFAISKPRQSTSVREKEGLYGLPPTTFEGRVGVIVDRAHLIVNKVILIEYQ